MWRVRHGCISSVVPQSQFRRPPWGRSRDGADFSSSVQMTSDRLQIKHPRCQQPTPQRPPTIATQANPSGFPRHRVPLHFHVSQKSNTSRGLDLWYRSKDKPKAAPVRMGSGTSTDSPISHWLPPVIVEIMNRTLGSERARRESGGSHP